MIPAAPGVWRRPRLDLEQEIVEKCCGMVWGDAITEMKRLFSLRIAVLEIFAEAGRRR